MYPKISIITINYNNDAGLEKTICSVLAQTYTNIEYIIIDGGSSDTSVDIIKKYSQQVHYWISEKDKGVYNAQNKGIDQATGNYLLFLNSGDIFFSEKSIELLTAYCKDEHIIYGDIEYVYPNKNITYTFPDKLDFDFFYHNSLPHPASLIHKSLFDTYGKYDESLRICADWAFFVNAISIHKHSYKHVPSVISIFLIGGLSSNEESFPLIQKEKDEYLKNRLPELLELKKKSVEIESELKKIKHEIFLAKESRMLSALIYLMPKRVIKPLINLLNN